MKYYSSKLRRVLFLEPVPVLSIEGNMSYSRTQIDPLLAFEQAHTNSESEAPMTS